MGGGGAGGDGAMVSAVVSEWVDACQAESVVAEKTTPATRGGIVWEAGAALGNRRVLVGRSRRMASLALGMKRGASSGRGRVRGERKLLDVSRHTTATHAERDLHRWDLLDGVDQVLGVLL